MVAGIGVGAGTGVGVAVGASADAGTFGAGSGCDELPDTIRAMRCSMASSSSGGGSLVPWVDNNKDGLHRIMALAAQKKATVPDLSIRNTNTARGWVSVNLDLQMKEWAFKDHFAGAIIDNKTGSKLEYRDLIKRPELRK